MSSLEGAWAWLQKQPLNFGSFFCCYFPLLIIFIVIFVLPFFKWGRKHIWRDILWEGFRRVWEGFRRANREFDEKIARETAREERRNLFRFSDLPRKCSNCGSISSKQRWNSKGGCPACGCDYATLVDDPRYDP